MPKNYKPWDFSECPMFWAEMKKINIYNFPKEARIFKIAGNFMKYLRKKMS